MDDDDDDDSETANAPKFSTYLSGHFVDRAKKKHSHYSTFSAIITIIDISNKQSYGCACNFL
jgi:hypothetical protein